MAHKKAILVSTFLRKLVRTLAWISRRHNLSPLINWVVTTSPKKKKKAKIMYVIRGLRLKKKQNINHRQCPSTLAANSACCPLKGSFCLLRKAKNQQFFYLNIVNFNEAPRKRKFRDFAKILKKNEKLRERRKRISDAATANARSEDVAQWGVADEQGDYLVLQVGWEQQRSQVFIL
jgi:hypothetical protein